MQKIEIWKNNVFPSNLKPTDARTAIQATIGRTLSYPLPATALTKAQCKNINSLLVKYALPKAGIVRTAPSSLVFSPEDIMGFGLKDIETEQMSEHIYMMLEHGSEDTVTGQLIRNLCEGIVLQCGVGGDIFDLHSSFCTWVEENWVWSTIRSMEDLNINITHGMEQLVK